MVMGDLEWYEFFFVKMLRQNIFSLMCKIILPMKEFFSVTFSACMIVFSLNFP